MLTDQISEVIHVGGKRVAWRLAVLMFWCGPVTTMKRLVERWPISRIVSTGKTEIDEKVSRWAPGPRISLYLMTKVFTSADGDRVERIGIHICRVKHDILPRAVPIEISLGRAVKKCDGGYTDEQHCLNA